MDAAMTGLKPIAEIMFADFIAVCYDYIANEFPKSRYMTNGQVNCPLVVRVGNGGGARFGAQHSQCVENWCMQFPGLKVVRSEEHTSELQSLMRISYAVLCLKKKKTHK